MCVENHARTKKLYNEPIKIIPELLKVYKYNKTIK